MTSPTQPEVSAERREQVRALWRRYGGTLRHPEQLGGELGVATTTQFWSFIARFDAQAKAEADARVAETQTVAFQAQEMAKEIASNADARVEAMRDALKIADMIFQFDLRPMIEFGPHFNQAVKDAADATQAALALPIEGDGR